MRRRFSGISKQSNGLHSRFTGAIQFNFDVRKKKNLLWLMEQAFADLLVARRLKFVSDGQIKMIRQMDAQVPFNRVTKQ